MLPLPTGKCQTGSVKLGLMFHDICIRCYNMPIKCLTKASEFLMNKAFAMFKPKNFNKSNISFPLFSFDAYSSQSDAYTNPCQRACMQASSGKWLRHFAYVKLLLVIGIFKSTSAWLKGHQSFPKPVSISEFVLQFVPLYLRLFYQQ